MKQTDPDHFSEQKPHSLQWAALAGAGSIIGKNVCNHKDEALGSIKELMLDQRSGAVVYAVLSFGGLLGMGEKLFAVPWHALSLDAARQCVVLNVKKEALAGASGFDPDRWPEVADSAWADEIHSFYRSNRH